MRTLLFGMLLSGCVVHVGGLEPKPNLPGVDAPPSVSVALDGRIQQKTQVENVMLDTFRGDLKRGFLNGFPGAVKGDKGELVLALEAVEPSLQCFANVGCIAKLRFKGRFSDEDRAGLVSFAGESESGICNHDLDDCYTSVIERMYETIFAKTHAQLEARPARLPDARRAKTSEL